MKIIFIGLCALAMALPVMAGTYPLGVSAYTGFDVPVIQNDVGSGPMWALGVRGNIWHFLHGQLIVRGTSQGDKDEKMDFSDGVSETLTYKGGTLTGFGFHVLFAKKYPANIWPYGIIGVTSNSLNFGDSFKKDDTLVGWSYGGGLGINLYGRKIYLDANTTFLMMPFHDNKASRKNWQTLVGVQYFIPINTK